MRTLLYYYNVNYTVHFTMCKGFDYMACKSFKVGVVLGSDSDLNVMKSCFRVLESYNIPYEIRIISAHRTPRAAAEFASGARENGFGVLIAAAGKAAHLAGVLASYTTLPVIAVPIKASLEGLDSLLSCVQMPKGVPVATVAIDGAENAAILAAQILSLSNPAIEASLSDAKSAMEREIFAKDASAKDLLSSILNK